MIYFVQITGNQTARALHELNDKQFYVLFTSYVAVYSTKGNLVNIFGNGDLCDACSITVNSQGQWSTMTNNEIGHFSDAISVMHVSSMDLRWTLLLPNFLTYTQCQPCSTALGKFLLLVFMAKAAKKNCQTSIEKPYLAFDCKYVSWSLSLSKVCHPATANACSRSPRGNLWYPAVRTRVPHTPGGNCWQGLNYEYIHTLTGNWQNERTNIFLN